MLTGSRSRRVGSRLDLLSWVRSASGGLFSQRTRTMAKSDQCRTGKLGQYQIKTKPRAA